MSDTMKSKEINIIFNSNGEEVRKSASDLEAVLKSIESITRNSKITSYFKDQSSLIKKTEEAFKRYNEQASVDNAKELLKTTNALKAISSGELPTALKDVEKIQQLISSKDFKKIELDNMFSIESFQKAFRAIDLMKKAGLDIEDIFTKLSMDASAFEELQSQIKNYENEIANLRATLSQKTKELEDVESGNGVQRYKDEIDELKYSLSLITEELEAVRDKATETFKSFLISNNLAGRNDWGDYYFDNEIFEKYFNALENGSMDAQQAIAQFKREYGYLLELGDKDGAFDISQLQDFSNKLDEISIKINDVADKVDRIQLDGIKVDSSGSHVNDFKEVIDTLDKMATTENEVSSSTINMYESLGKIFVTLKELASVDGDNLFHLYAMLKHISKLEDLKINKASLENLANCIERLCAIENVSALNALYNVDFTKFNDLHISKSSLNNLATYLPEIASVNVDNLLKLSNIDFSNFNNIDTKSLSALKDFVLNLKNILQNENIDESPFDSSSLTENQDKIQQELKETEQIAEQTAESLEKVNSNGNKSNISSGQPTIEDVFQSDNNSSIKFVDNFGRELDEVNSKLLEGTALLNEQGQLIRLYHGSDVEFDKFDLSKSTNSSNQIYGKGAYLIETEKGAQGYGNVVTEWYANVRKVLHEEQNLTLEEAKKLYNEFGSELLNVYGERMNFDEFFDNYLSFDPDQTTIVEKLKRLSEFLGKDIGDILTPLGYDAIKISRDNGSFYSIFDPDRVIRFKDETQKAIDSVEELNRAKETSNSSIDTNSKSESDSSSTAQEEASEFEKVTEATKGATQAKEDFATANENVQNSANDSKSPLQLEAELMQQIAKDARDAADAKKEFVKANKQVKDSADDSNGSVKKDKYKNRTKISEDDYNKNPNYYASIANKKLTDNGNSILGNSVNTEFINGLVKVSAKIKTADGDWKFFSARIDADGNMFEQRFNAITKGINKLNNELENFGNDSIDETSKKKDELDSIFGKIDSFKKSQQRLEILPDGEHRFQSWTNALENLSSKIKDLQDLESSLKDGNFNDSDVEKARNLKNEIEGIIVALNHTPQGKRGWKDVASTNLAEKVNKILEDNPRLSKAAKDAIKAYYDELKSGHPSKPLDEIKDSINRIIESEREAGRTGKGFLDILKSKVVGNFAAQLVSYYLSWTDIIRYTKEGIETVRELDTALTEMRKVSDEPVSSLKNYQASTFDIASEIGTTAAQIQNSTADFMRLGESIDEAADSAKTANILLNVSEFDSIDSATESLIAMSSAYKDLSKMDIVDVMNKIGNEYSISTDGIATALQDSASSLVTANNDLYEATALIAAGNAVTQDPSKVGSGLRTIALRLTGTEAAKEDLSELGEDTDTMITSVSKLRSTIKQATAAATNDGKGFDILDENGNYKSTYEIMKGLADLYDDIVAKDKELGTNNLNLLLETIAGKNRSNIAASILQNGDMLESVFESAQNAEGSALEENKKYLDSIDGRQYCHVA